MSNAHLTHHSGVSRFASSFPQTKHPCWMQRSRQALEMYVRVRTEKPEANIDAGLCAYKTESNEHEKIV
jgi:hypothetical protein